VTGHWEVWGGASSHTAASEERGISLTQTYLNILLYCIQSPTGASVPPLSSPAKDSSVP